MIRAQSRSTSRRSSGLSHLTECAGLAENIGLAKSAGLRRGAGCIHRAHGGADSGWLPELKIRLLRFQAANELPGRSDINESP